MWALVRGEPETVVRWAGPMLLIGLLLGFASARLECAGVITATFAVGLGAVGGVFMHWRHDRGLCMLAVLFLLIYATCYTLMIFGQVRDIVRGARQPDLGVVTDCSLGTLLLSVTVRFLWQVAKDNWAFSRESGNE